MAKSGSIHVSEAMAAFSANLEILKKLHGYKTDTELAQAVKRKSRGNGAPSKKTVNNVLQARHDASVSTLEAMADAVDSPLWVLLMPGLRVEDLMSPAKERLIALVRDYLTCGNDYRALVENVATTYARMPRKP